MTYHKILRKAVQESGLSMREICRRCTDQGVKVSQGYLSQLCRDGSSPASEKVNNILAKVLNIDADKLLVAAYREKVPAAVLEKLAGAN